MWSRLTFSPSKARRSLSCPAITTRRGGVCRFDHATTVAMMSSPSKPLEAAYDNFAFLKGRGVVGSYVYTFDDQNIITWIAEHFTTKTYTDGSKISLTTPAVKVGDIVLIDFWGLFGCQVMDIGEWGDVRVMVTQNAGGGGVAAPLTDARIFLPGSYRLTGDPANSSRLNTMGSASGRVVVSAAGPLKVGIQGKTGNTAGGFVDIVSVAGIRATVLRAI